MPGPRISTNFLGMNMVIEAELDPASPGDDHEPPKVEQMDIGGIFAEDGVTPIALTDRQADELEAQLLREYHAEADYRDFADRR